MKTLTFLLYVTLHKVLYHVQKILSIIMREKKQKNCDFFVFFRQTSVHPLTFACKWGILVAMEAYQHTTTYRVRYCDADFKDELKTSAFLSYLEESACDSADELGFGYAYVKPRGYAFFVTGYYCRFLRPVKLGAAFTLKTWPTPPTAAIFGREFQLFDGEELLAEATSRWCLMDVAQGKILPSKRIDNQDYTTYNTKKLLPEWGWKIPVFAKEEGELRFSMTVRNAEYDHNMHVNNTRYADYCFNCFTVAELAEMRLTSFAIRYVKQCKEGDLLSFYAKRNGEAWLVQGYNQCDDLVVQTQMTFA